MRAMPKRTGNAGHAGRAAIGADTSGVQDPHTSDEAARSRRFPFEDLSRSVLQLDVGEDLVALQLNGVDDAVGCGVARYDLSRAGAQVAGTA